MYMNYEPEVEEVGAILAGLGLGLTVLGIMFVIIFAAVLIMVIAQWKIYQKMGKPGWTTLLPVHNTVVLYEKVGLSPALLFIPMYSAIIPILGWFVVAPGSAIVLSILAQVKLAKAFGKGAGFAIGLIFLGVVFYPILGFGEAKYLGIDGEGNGEVTATVE